MFAYIVNSNTMSVVGYVQNVEGVDAKEDQILLNKPEDLHNLTNQQLTDLFNAMVKLDKGDDAPVVAKFKTAKEQSASRVFKTLEAIDVAKLIQLDKVEEQVVEKQATEVAKQQAEDAAFDEAQPSGNGKKIRKVRDSKLQRMKAAFLTKEEAGDFKQWTVKELMERCGTSERITHVYISILRSPSDRFVMNIEKLPVVEGNAPQFMYKPKEDRKASSAPSEQPAAE
jgi:hypothetical protein